MRVVFRTDASLNIGTGHVMRCATLANELSKRGASCSFVCREHRGHLFDFIRQQGHAVISLPYLGDPDQANFDQHYESWLGTDWKTDAYQTINSIAQHRVDLLITDHYAIDYRWEVMLQPVCKRLMVIDDLADRSHDCDILIDQNLGRRAEDYRHRLKLGTQVFIGPLYALIRPEFALWRKHSLERRKKSKVKHLLIAMGGIDKNNLTHEILDCLHTLQPSLDINITVLLSAQAPWLEQIKAFAVSMSQPTRVLTGISNVAEVMSGCDIAVGAAGGTAWERCTLGLPSILLLQAENQSSGSAALQAAGAAKFALNINEVCNWVVHFSSTDNIDMLETMTLNASQICDGMGVSRVAEQIMIDYD